MQCSFIKQLFRCRIPFVREGQNFPIPSQKRQLECPQKSDFRLRQLKIQDRGIVPEQ